MDIAIHGRGHGPDTQLRRRIARRIYGSQGPEGVLSSGGGFSPFPPNISWTRFMTFSAETLFVSCSLTNGFITFPPLVRFNNRNCPAALPHYLFFICLTS